MTDFAGLLRVLNESGVEFIVIGGVAAAIHGAIRTTRDLDVVYARTGGERADRTLPPDDRRRAAGRIRAKSA